MTAHPPDKTVPNTPLDEIRAQSGLQPIATLRLLYSGPHGFVKAASWPLPAASVIIGRGAHCGFSCSDDKRVSREHARLEPTAARTPQRWLLHDNDSQNGVYVNNKRIQQQELQDGDLIQIGHSFLLYRYGLFVTDAEPPSAPRALVGCSPQICALRTDLAKYAKHDGHVFITGETGTGKELVAKALHDAGSRAKAPFVSFNCSNIPEQMAESTLFGHVKGAFTGAVAPFEGQLRSADQGTLFLDEIADMPLPIQAKLLRAIEEQAVTPIGSTAKIPINVRIFSAANRDMIAAVNNESFRKDLYFRLANITIATPSLRARKEDILPILFALWGPHPPEISPDLASALLLHNWPGNVRELKNIVEELKSKRVYDNRFKLKDISYRLAENSRILISGSESKNPSARAISDKQESLTYAASQRDERPPSQQELINLLKLYKGNISRVAKHTGKSRTSVQRWLEKYVGINRKDFE
jgi:transcriptional regulator with PAS, ATPase and Fis domain